MSQETVNIADAQETSRLIYNKYHPENQITTQRIIDDFYRNLMDGQPAAIKAITDEALSKLKAAKPTDAKQLEDAKIQADISFLDAVKAAVVEAEDQKLVGAENASDNSAPVGLMASASSAWQTIKTYLGLQ